MRKSFAALLGLGFATTALAGPVWTKPGWYQVAATMKGVMLVKGPFDDEQSCKAKLPPDGDDSLYNCVYYDAKPDFDDK